MLQLSRIVLDSKNPLWQKSDLRQTRLKDVERGELLIFKEVRVNLSKRILQNYMIIFYLNAKHLASCRSRGSRCDVVLCPQLSWQTLRVEAKSTCDQALTPLRLITNQARCRITIKKKLGGEEPSCLMVLFLHSLISLYHFLG